MRHTKNIGVILFLIGLFSKTQLHLIGYLGLSELFIFGAAPFFFFRNLHLLKKDGMMPIIVLSFLAMFGCLISSIWNQTDFARFVRGFAQTYAVFASLVVMHRYLREDIMAIKWCFLGMFLSGLISIYWLQGTALTRVGASINLSGDAAVEEITTSALFWTGRILPVITLPVTMFYMRCPWLYAVTTPLVLALFSLTTSKGSGRSVFLSAVISFCLLFVGGKSQVRLRRLMRMFWVYALLLLVLFGSLKAVYSYVAVNGMLGEHAERKYREQTRRGTDALSMIISGRTDFFVGLYACTQRPIMGYGPWPQDRYGYREYFFMKYGTDEEQKNAMEYRNVYAMKSIPAHSHLVGYWLEYGILALPFWFYVIWLMFRYLRYDLDVLPPLFGWMACTIPMVLWSILFSPFAARIGIPMLIVGLILIRAIKRGLIPLGRNLIAEIQKGNHE